LIREVPSEVVHPAAGLGTSSSGLTQLFVERATCSLMTLSCSYYEKARTHLALDKDTPIPRPVMPAGAGDLVAIPEVGGLHHRYERRAA
jgi:hypothetical protein